MSELGRWRGCVGNLRGASTGRRRPSRHFDDSFPALERMRSICAATSQALCEVSRHT